MRDDGLADDFLRGQRVEVCDCIVRRISCRAQAVMPDERLRFTADATLAVPTVCSSMTRRSLSFSPFTMRAQIATSVYHYLPSITIYFFMHYIIKN